MFVAGGLLSLAHRFEMVTTDFGGNNLIDYLRTGPILHASYFTSTIAMLVLFLLIAVKIFFTNPLQYQRCDLFLNNAAGDHYGLHLIDGFLRVATSILLSIIFARNS